MNKFLVNKQKMKDGLKFFSRQIVIIVLAMLIATVIIAISGFEIQSVMAGFANALTDDFSGTLRWFIPLIFTGLACAVSFRAGIWNMGADGQLYMGALISTAIALKLDFLPTPVLLVLAVLGGLLSGAVCGIIVALLRVYFGAPEVVSSMLMNYIIFYYSDYMVMGPLKGTGDYAVAQSSDVINEGLWFPLLIEGTNVSIALIAGILLAVALWFVMSKTSFGYQSKMLGTNRAFSNYGGINIKASYIKIMALSGAIAAAAGVVEIFGIHHRFPFRFTSDLGYDGMVVAILANNNPIGSLVSAFFFAILRNGSYNIERLSDVPRTLVLVVQAIIIILVGAKYVIDKKKKKVKADKTKTVEVT